MLERRFVDPAWRRRRNTINKAAKIITNTAAAPALSEYTKARSAQLVADLFV